jgi:hypothetical protein
MDCNKTDCIHYEVCKEWKLLGNDNYINDSYQNCGYYKVEQPQGEWKFDWSTYCSECGYRPRIGGGNFCSNCGAKMKQG